MRSFFRKRIFVLFFVLVSAFSFVSRSQTIDVAAQVQAQFAYQQSLQNYYLQQQQKAAVEAAQKQTLLQAIAGICPKLFESKKASTVDEEKLEDTADEVEEVVKPEMDKQGFEFAEGMDQAIAKQVGEDADKAFGSTCEKFINKEGKLGAWGAWAHQLIEK